MNATRSLNNPAFHSRRRDVAAHIGWLPGPLKGLFGGKDEDEVKKAEKKQQEETAEEDVKEEIAEEPEGERNGSKQEDGVKWKEKLFT